MTEPMISVILPTYNRSSIVEETLLRLLNCDYPSGRFELLVADNSSDGTPEMVNRVASSARTPVRLLSSEHRLPAVKRNDALRAATGDIVIFINDDLWVRPCFFREHVKTHLVHDEPVAVLGAIEQSPSMPSTPFIEWYEPFAYHELEGRDGESLPYRYFWSMNLSLPRQEMLDRNLVFHEDWAEIGHEDIELGYRWTSAGRKLIYNEHAFGEHYHPHSLASACRLQESVGRGLRDMEVLVPDSGLLERYGVFSWRNSRRAVVRGLARKTLFNKMTLPVARSFLERLRTNGPIARWMYWKVLLHYTEKGYAQAPPRAPQPVPIRTPEPSTR